VRSKPRLPLSQKFNFLQLLRRTAQRIPEMSLINLSPIRYERWIRVVFDHPATTVSEPPTTEEPEGWQVGIEFTVSDPARLVSHFAQMCREFVALAEQFSLPQLNQGLWFLLLSDVMFGEFLADEGIPLVARLDCVRSILVPFRDFVALSEVEVLENCFYMWWDLLASAFWSAQLWDLKENELMESMLEGNGAERMDNIEINFSDLNEDGRAVLDAMLETLLAIVQLDDERTVYYGLHGLGHLRHPEGSEWLQRYIDDNREDFDEAGIKWLEQCRDGTVM
jgi:hypothetical protein